MARQTRKTKPLIYVFCEEADTAVIKCVPQTGLFQEAKDKFDKEPRYRDNVDVTDEIWFFFDVEDDEVPAGPRASIPCWCPLRSERRQSMGYRSRYAAYPR